MSARAAPALRFVRRWRWALGGLAAAAAGALLFGRAALSGAPVPAALLAVTLAAGLWLARDGWLRGRLDARLGSAPGPGVASVREGRIEYFGPWGGGSADLDALLSISVAVRRDGARWLLRPDDGPALAIPASAEGAGALPDAFAALPGFDPLRVARALEAGVGADVIVWTRRRDAAPGSLALRDDRP